MYRPVNATPLTNNEPDTIIVYDWLKTILSGNTFFSPLTNERL